MNVKRSRVELFEKIRRARRVDASVSIHELARRFGTHRRTVREALLSAVPEPRQPVVDRPCPVMGPWKEIIDQWLTDDLTAPRKQRHTGRRVWERLVDEHQATASERAVRKYVKEAKERIGCNEIEVMVPQQHPLGFEAEVDFGAISFYLAGVFTVGEMFVMRLSASGKAFRRAYLHEAQEVFFDGHVRAFDTFGGVPARIRYDNLTPAVVKVLRGRDRVENDRFTAMRSHHGFDSFFCQPGEGGAHEKGGVEGEIGRFRRRRFVPVPRVETMEELNELLDAIVESDDARHIAQRFLTVKEHFQLETVTLQPLPVDVFDCRLLLSCRVDSKSRVCVRQCFYSVPVRFVGRKLDVRLGAERVEAFDGATRIADHARAVGKGVETLVLDHYLEILVRKPGAMPNATALARAKATGVFTPLHQQFWDAARKRDGDRQGTVAMIDVLLLHRQLPTAAVLAGIAAALKVGSLDPAVVAIEARRSGQHSNDAVVIPIGEHLARFDRPKPVLNHYDNLLEAQ
jgi:transposase